MSRSEAARGRQTVFECEECGHATRIHNAVPASSLSLALEALRDAEQHFRIARDESSKGNEVTTYSFVTTGLNGVRAVLDQLEEGERPQTASTRKDTAE